MRLVIVFLVLTFMAICLGYKKSIANEQFNNHRSRCKPYKKHLHENLKRQQRIQQQKRHISVFAEPVDATPQIQHSTANPQPVNGTEVSICAFL